MEKNDYGKMGTVSGTTTHTHYKCPKCDKYIWNGIPIVSTAFVEYCKCNEEEKKFAFYNPGWQCPRCGRGNAPYVSYCPCMPLPEFKITC